MNKCDCVAQDAPTPAALIAMVIPMVLRMTDADRLEFVNLLTDVLCTYCGGDAPCQCWNDE